MEICENAARSMCFSTGYPPVKKHLFFLLAAAVLRTMFLRSRKRTSRPTAINDRDREYLRLLFTVPEPTPAQIADAMHRSVKTVEKRRYKMVRKLGPPPRLDCTWQR